MSLPGFFSNFDALDLPIPDHMAKTYAIRSERGLMVVFDILEDISIPPHAHKGQWGTVLEGELHRGGSLRNPDLVRLHPFRRCPSH